MAAGGADDRNGLALLIDGALGHGGVFGGHAVEVRAVVAIDRLVCADAPHIAARAEIKFSSVVGAYDGAVGSHGDLVECASHRLEGTRGDGAGTAGIDGRAQGKE